MAGCGAVLGMLGSGVLLRFWPWQSIFWALAAAAAVLFVLTLDGQSIRATTDAPPVDWPGAALIGRAVAVLVFGIVEAPSRGWSDPLVIGACARRGAGGRIRRSSRSTADIRFSRIPVRRADFADGAAAIAVLFLATSVHVPASMQYTQLILGYSALQPRWPSLP